MVTIDLVILGMIKARPQSAYDLQKDVEYRNISKWVRISTQSIYSKVIRLEEKGYLESRIEKESKMPEKTIYSITEAGEEYFLKLMKKVAGSIVKVILDFDAVIMSLDLVPDSMRQQLLEQIEDGIVDMKERLEINLNEKEQDKVPLVGMAILKQQYQIAITLQQWMEEFKKEYLE